MFRIQRNNKGVTSTMKKTDNLSSLSEWQKIVAAEVESRGGYYPPLVCLAALTEEVGELAREVNHRQGIKCKRGENADFAAEEAGDVLFTLICLANQLNINLDQQLSLTVDKWLKRQQD